MILVSLAAGLACAAIAAVTFRVGLDRVRMELQSARLALGATAVVALLALAALNGPLGRAWGEFKNDKSAAANGKKNGEKW